MTAAKISSAAGSERGAASTVGDAFLPAPGAGGGGLDGVDEEEGAHGGAGEDSGPTRHTYDEEIDFM